MDTIRRTLSRVASHLHPSQPGEQKPAAEQPANGAAAPKESFAASAPAAAAPETAMAAHTRAPPEPRAGSVDTQNPIAGKSETAPKLTAGTLRSPRFLGTEAEYFAEAHATIANAKPGEMICLQMYEFE